MRQILDRLQRQIALFAGMGKVTFASDPGGPVQRLQIQLSEVETHDGEPRLAEYGFASLPHVGADTVSIYLQGDRGSGIIIATGDQRYRLALAEGEVAVHDDLGRKVHLTRAGMVIDGGPDPIIITTTGPINLNADGAVIVTAGGTVQLGATGGRKVVLDGDPVVGGQVQASSTKVTAT